MNDNIVQNQKDNKKLITIIAAIAIVFAILLIVIIKSVGGDSKKIRAGLNDGFKFLEELKFDDAIAAYEKVLELDPQNVDAYLGIAKGYVGLGNEAFAVGDTSNALYYFDNARSIIETGISVTGDKSGTLYEYMQDEVMPILEAYDYGDSYSGDIEDMNDYTGFDNDDGLLDDFQKLVKSGLSDDMLAKSDITFFGYSPWNVNIRDWESIAMENGYTEYTWNNSDESGLQYSLEKPEDDGFGSSIGVGSWFSTEGKEYGSVFIGMGDSDNWRGNLSYRTDFLDLSDTTTPVELFSKIGFTNAEAIYEFLLNPGVTEDSVYGTFSYMDKDEQLVTADFISEYVTYDDGRVSYVSGVSYYFSLIFEDGANLEFYFADATGEYDLRLCEITVHPSYY